MRRNCQKCGPKKERHSKKECHSKKEKCNSCNHGPITITKVTEIKKTTTITKVRGTVEPEVLTVSSCVTGFVGPYAPNTWTNLDDRLDVTFDTDLELKKKDNAVVGIFCNTSIYILAGEIRFDWSRGPGSPTLEFRVGDNFVEVPPTGGHVVVQVPATPNNVPVTICFFVFGAVGDEVTIDEFEFAPQFNTIGFTGPYAPDTWEGDKWVTGTFGDAGSSLTLTYSMGNEGSSYFCNTALRTCAGTFSFQATTNDSSGIFGFGFQSELEGNIIPIPLNNTEVSVPVEASGTSLACFVMESSAFASPTVVITNFRFVKTDNLCGC